MRSGLSVLSVLALASCASAPDAPASAPASVVVAFDREMRRVLVAEGFADAESGRRVTTESPVRIASISKLIVALGVMRMVEAGQLDLDRDVSDYLGWRLRNPNRPDEAITLRMLLSHRAGLRDAGDYVIPLGETLRERLARPQAWAKPDAQGHIGFEYGNINSPVIASVMEQVSGERFDRLMTRLVFAPLDIDACMNWSGCSDEAVARAVVLYTSAGEVARDDLKGRRPECLAVAAADGSCDLAGYVPGTNGSLFSPQGGVRISGMDLARIGQMIARRGEGFLSAASLAELARPHGDEASGAPWFCRYGLAVQTLGAGGPDCDERLFADDAFRIGHAGDAYGLRSGLWLDPATGEGVAYFTTRVPARTDGKEGGFTAEEIALLARARRAGE